MSIDQPSQALPTVSVPPTPGLTATIRDGLIALAHEQASEGRPDRDYFLERASDDLGLDDNGEPEARVVFDAVMAAWLARQEQRRADGIRSNIDTAFAELDTQGVIARGNFTCCGTCASTEIYDETPVGYDGEWLGYVYFHSQDAARIFESGSTYLGYGVNLARYFTEAEWQAMPDEQRSDFYVEKCDELIKSFVEPTLTKHGMSVTWSGETTTRVLATGIVDYIIPLDLDD